jgi:transposase InsO family protein
MKSLAGWQVSDQGPVRSLLRLPQRLLSLAQGRTQRSGARRCANWRRTAPPPHTESRHLWPAPLMRSVAPAWAASLLQAHRAADARTLGLKGVQRGRFRVQTTKSSHGLKCAPNRLLHAPPINQSNQVWVADITFVSTAEGWLYVAGVLDRHSRRVLGLGFGARLDCGLTERALRQALVRRGGKATGRSAPSQRPRAAIRQWPPISNCSPARA